MHCFLRTQRDWSVVTRSIRIVLAALLVLAGAICLHASVLGDSAVCRAGTAQVLPSLLVATVEE